MLNTQTDFKPIDGNGTIIFGGIIKFGFECPKCGSRFRHDYRNHRQCDEAAEDFERWKGDHKRCS